VTLPLLISVPHAGLTVPEEAQPYCVLTEEQIVIDGDGDAGDVFDIVDYVEAHVTTNVARAIVDMNRPETDRGPDGIVKTHTCQNVPVYSEALPTAIIETLLAQYYRPYHGTLTELAHQAALGVDCHTMAAVAPPIGPNPGSERPPICVSNADLTCPESWLRQFASCLQEAFEADVGINRPFKGGHIIRAHAAEIPWIQLELSRAPFLANAEKRERVLEAMRLFCELAL
jgi:formiminoglutamase